MKRILDIEKSIFEKFVSQTGDSVLLKENAKKHVDPSLKELIEEITGTKKANKKDIGEGDAFEKEDEKATKVDSNLISLEQIKVDLDKRINFLMSKINLFLFEFKKEDFKKIIKSDCEEYFYKQGKIFDKKEVYEYIDNIIEKKFFELFFNKNVRYKNLLYNYLNSMLKEIDNFFETNNREKLQKMSMLQKKNLIHFFLIYLYKKYLDRDKDSGLLNREEYDFLKEKIRLFIVFKYEKILKGE